MEFVKSKLEPIMITIDGVEYPARLNFRALSELEELTKCSFLALFDKFANGNCGIGDILNIIYVSLKNGGVDVTLDDICELEFSTEILNNLMSEIMVLLNRTQKVVSVIEDIKEKGHASKKEKK